MLWVESHGRIGIDSYQIPVHESQCGLTWIKSLNSQGPYLYRAVDKQGRTVDFHLSATRGIEAAKTFFRKALAAHPARPPRKITLDGHVPSHRAVRLLRREHPAWRRAELRCCQYLNNIVGTIGRSSDDVIP